MVDFNACIYLWYASNKRDLPWRNTANPYYIWLSEIILQQTRVDQGINYYFRFTESFPTIFDLANASEDEVLKLWQGLGYYSRARNLHSTSKTIVDTLNGIFPSEYQELIKLKGIGEYTAAAIASISFNQPYAVVDGNVFRFFSRYFGINKPIDTSEGKQAFKQIATQLLGNNNPGMHNEAVMEFGALQCIPANPDCSVCPLVNSCFAFTSNRINEFPVKNSKQKQRSRYFNYLVLISGESTYICKRTENDIWKNLYEFPVIETINKISIEELLTKELDELVSFFQELQIESTTEWQIHQLSHQKIHFRFIVIRVSPKKFIHPDLINIHKKDIFNFAVPKLIENFINKKTFF